MSVVSNFLIIASYAVMSAVAGLILSQSVPGLPAYAAYTAAGAGFLTAVLLHEMLTRRRDGDELSGQIDGAMQEIDEMREINRGLMQDLARAREEMATLCEVVEGATEDANRTLLREVKVLQAQLSRLPPRKPSSTPAPAPAQPTLVLTDDVVLPTPEVDDITAIQDSLEANRVDLFLQPMVSLPQRKTRFYEAFGHLRLEDGRRLAPEDYLEVAKGHGLIATIDNLLLFRCVQLVRRLKMRRTDIGFFVNISSHTVNDTDFLIQFADFLASNRGLANHLVLEFAEDDVRTFSPEVVAQLTRLSTQGFRLSMDRVRTLDLDVHNLFRLGFRFVKVPAELLLAPASSTDARVDPRDLKEMLGRVDIDLIVEKIERERQVVEILELDVDFGQGYLFGEPRQAREEAQAA